MDEQGNSFGYWLRRRRKALDLTQVVLGQKVSCSPAAIKKIEAGERRPSRALAQRLADHLAIPAHEQAGFLEAARKLGAADRLRLDELPVRALATAASASIAQSAHRTTPFVGRDKEYGRLLGLIAGLTSGNGRVVLIQGEAGIGKSRLVHEAVKHAQQQALATLTTNCYEIERAIAYQPVIDLVTQACQALSESRLRMIAPILLAEIAALAPAVAARLAELPPLSVDFPEARQARLFHALVQLFDALAQDQQLILTIDNIQWADDASLQFLHFLARQIAGRPMLLLCAYRDEELGGNERLTGLLESLRHEPTTLQMALARLGPGDTEELLEIINDPNLGAPSLAARLHRETDGNPFFLWSILHSLSEGESVISDALRLPLPDALRDSVRARLARVTQEDRLLLDVAAVLGRRFDFEILLSLSRMPEARFLLSLDSLVMRRLLHEEQESGSYDFSHDKVREVVYRDIGVARRVLLHREVAEMLECHAEIATHERDAHLAEHYERGKVWPKALLYLCQAAEHSQKLFAMRETLQWFDRAASLLQAHPEAATQAQQLALYDRRGQARAQAGQIEGAVADFQRVIDSARALGHHERARDGLIQLGMAYRRADAYEKAVACLDEALTASRATNDERHVADTLYHLGTVAWSNGRNDLAITYHQQAVAICERLALSDLIAVQAFHGRGEAYFANAEPAAAIQFFSRSLDLAREIDDKSYESENLMMIGWACTGHMGLADFPRALSQFDAALDIARAADLQWHIGPTLIGRAHAQMALGRFGQAWTDLKEALPQLESLGLLRYQIMAHDAIGCLFLDLNCHEPALQHFQRGLTLAHDVAIMYWVPRLQANLAIARLRCGIAGDRAVLQGALQYSQDHSEVWLTLCCLEALAESALANGDADGCIRYADRLLALSSRGNMRQLIGQAHRLRGLAWLAVNACESAGEELAQALTLAKQIGRVRLAWDCHLALARVAAALGNATSEHDHLTSASALAAQIAENLRGSGLTSNLEAALLKG